MTDKDRKKLELHLIYLGIAVIIIIILQGILALFCFIFFNFLCVHVLRGQNCFAGMKQNIKQVVLMLLLINKYRSVCVQTGRRL